jgi:hypothetical protein
MSAADWQKRLTKADAAREIRAAISAFSSYIVVQLVTDLSPVERPFFIAFDAASAMGGPVGPITALCERAAALGQRLRPGPSVHDDGEIHARPTAAKFTHSRSRI